MVKQITPLSFTAAFTAKFSHHLSHTSLCYKLLNSGSRLHSNEHVNQWQSGAVEIMILSTSGRLYRSKSINHRAAFQRKWLNYCTCQIHCGQAEKLVFFFFFLYWMLCWILKACDQTFNQGIMRWNNLEKTKCHIRVSGCWQNQDKNQYGHDKQTPWDVIIVSR